MYIFRKFTPHPPNNWYNYIYLDFLSINIKFEIILDNYQGGMIFEEFKHFVSTPFIDIPVFQDIRIITAIIISITIITTMKMFNESI